MSHIEVNTQSGRLRGRMQKNIDGDDFYAFRGIPYAKPPVGDLRFQDPIPIPPWPGVKEAIEYGPICAQVDPFVKLAGGSDDCLYLNVFTRALDPNKRLAVMVWIHGGGFVFGSGGEVFYGPENLMKKDVVLVTFNYRLGIFGFLNLEHQLAPGNQGLKDQVLVLEWVRDNIRNFGGNPGNVTIFGESAGGASVHLLTVSPLSKGLFHKAISQSGVSLNPWTMYVGKQIDAVKKICRHLEKNTEDPVEMIEFLKTLDPMKLVEVVDLIKNTQTESETFSLFCPTVDNEAAKPFLSIPREEAVLKGAHVPYLIGHNNSEGVMIQRILEMVLGPPTKETFSKLLHSDSVNLLREEYDLSIEDLQRLYLKSDNPYGDVEGIVQMVGDLSFVHGIHRVVKTQVERSAAPTYMYKFTYGKEESFSKTLYDSKVEGATHMDELVYLFGMKYLDSKNLTLQKGTKAYQVMEQMIELWTNFAKTSIPTPSPSKLVPLYWQPVVNGTVLRYLNIGEELRMEKMLNVEERLLSKKNGSPNF